MPQVPQRPQRQKSVRTIVAEVVMYVGMAAIVGQIAANFWERFMVEKELANMKNSLHLLKFTINNIGTAYDNLHKDLKHLLATTEREAFSPKPSAPAPVPYKRSRNLEKCKRDVQIEVRTVAEPKRARDVATDLQRTVRDFIQQCKLPLCKNVSMLTRYPLKSTAVGKDEELELDTNNMCYRVRKCYNRNKDGGRIEKYLRYDNL